MTKKSSKNATSSPVKSNKPSASEISKAWRARKGNEIGAVVKVVKTPAKVKPLELELPARIIGQSFIIDAAVWTAGLRKAAQGTHHKDDKIVSGNVLEFGEMGEGYIIFAEHLYKILKAEGSDSMTLTLQKEGLHIATGITKAETRAMSKKVLYWQTEKEAKGKEAGRQFADMYIVYLETDELEEADNQRVNDDDADWINESW